MFPEQIQTPRLVLRKPCRDDAPVMFATYSQDEAVTRYLGWRPHADISEAYVAVDRFIAGWDAATDFFWFLIDPAGHMMGAIAARSDGDAIHLGFLLARAYWGRGYMPEAINAIVSEAFKHPAIARVWAACDLENTASARALEKAGFERQGVLPGFVLLPNLSQVPRDCYRYEKRRT